LIYLLLGASSSGRREVLADLIDGGLGADDRAAVLVSEGEKPVGKAVGGPEPATWRWIPPHASGESGTIEASFPADATHVFLVSDGHVNPVDQIEAFKAWLAGRGTIGRVICVVNCRLAEQNPRLVAWYDACIHFSDVVLLNRREGVTNKWISDFRARYTDQFYPCLFEIVKAGRVANPALILEPLALRMSHVFEEETDWLLRDEDGEIVEDEDDAKEGEEMTATPVEDIYLVRLSGGRREKDIPDVSKFHDKAFEKTGP
jgi:hypothetical protein